MNIDRIVGCQEDGRRPNLFRCTELTRGDAVDDRLKILLHLLYVFGRGRPRRYRANPNSRWAVLGRPDFGQTMNGTLRRV